MATMQNAVLKALIFGAAAWLGLLPLCADAQDEAAASAVEPRRYTVEVIVFRYAQDVSVGSEMFLPELPPAEPVDDVVEGESIFGDRADSALPENPPEPGDAQTATEFDFVPLAADEYTLEDTYRRLQRLDVYEPMLHVAWTQTTLPDEQTHPIDLLALAEPPAGLEGSFKLYLSRYLHLVVDLTLDASPTTTAGAADAAFSYRDGRHDTASAGSRGRLLYRIDEDRIFKSGDLRYFDHPKFGVLAKVTRVEEDPDSGIEREMLGYDPADLPGSGSQ